MKQKFLNAAKCLKCGDIIESKFRHDFVKCSCGEIFVDGGSDYFRYGYENAENFQRIFEKDISYTTKDGHVIIETPEGLAIINPRAMEIGDTV